MSDYPLPPLVDIPEEKDIKNKDLFIIDANYILTKLNLK